jgi:chemotaxis protein MotB
MGPAAPVIIVKKKGHAHGHHGGAWKVAYADFVTAMMAFFLVMWLVGQSKSVKAGVAGYFRDPGAFDAHGGNGILTGGKQLSDKPPDAPPAATGADRAALEKSVAHIRERLNSVPDLGTLRKQIEFTITDEGLRIDLLESNGSSFFDSGSANMHQETEKVLGIIARELGTLGNEIAIEGHTDSRPYANGERYTNWELSADRANAARRIVARDGVRPDQIVSVRGFADRQPKFATDPMDPRNRRVSVVVKSPSK